MVAGLTPAAAEGVLGRGAEAVASQLLAPEGPAASRRASMLRRQPSSSTSGEF